MLDRPEAHLGKLAEQAEADLICFGHIHIPYHRAVKTESGRIAHFVSDGSVGKPKDGDPRACWAEIVIGSAEEVEALRAARRIGGVRRRCVGGRAVPSGGRTTSRPWPPRCWRRGCRRGWLRRWVAPDRHSRQAARIRCGELTPPRTRRPPLG